MENTANSVSQSAAFDRVTEDILAPLWRPGRVYLSLLLLTFALVVTGGYIWDRLINVGLGLWGITRPAAWGIDIATFVFWIGITHSGTLISAIFYLFGVPWRASISRMAEAMTVFAIMTGGLFPIMHLGRAWFFYWLFPYPNQRHLWVNFRSPLIWDVFAVSTYFTISFLFWYMGMVPDLAAVRDRTTGWKRSVYGFFALRWRGTGEQWRHYRSSYLLLASITIPLAISVHSVVSWDFAMGIVPGWHSTIFAPYFVAGAIFSGLAMLLTLVILLRRAFHLEAYITAEHFDKLSKLLLFMSLLMTYAYGNEFFTAWYGGDSAERSSMLYRAFGAYRGLFWTMIVCNSVLPLLLFSKTLRCNLKALFSLSLLVNLGMYLERFIIVPVSLTHDFDPHLWRVYRPTIYEYGILAASFGFFFFLFLLFTKALPVVPMFEVKELFLPHAIPEPKPAVAAPAANTKSVPITNGHLLPRWTFPALAAAVSAGLAAFLLLAHQDPARAWRIFLVDAIFCAGIAMAGVALAAIFDVTNARWPVVIRELGLACAGYLPVSCVLILSLWFGRELFPRMASGTPPAFWLHPSFLFGREGVAGFLFCCTGIAYWRYSRPFNMNSGSTAAERNPARRLATALLIVYTVVCTLMAWDLVMSLSRGWASSIFGGLYITGDLYLGLALLTIAAVFMASRNARGFAVDAKVLRNLGLLLFSFSLLWIYFVFSQYLVIWYGNLPREISYVQLRTAQQPWKSLVILMLALSFVAPFLILLSRSAKQSRGYLLGSALAVIAGIWLDRFLMIAPSVNPSALHLGWPELLITAAFFSGFALAYFSFLRKLFARTSR